jgi:hypothetical protein
LGVIGLSRCCFWCDALEDHGVGRMGASFANKNCCPTETILPHMIEFGCYVKKSCAQMHPYILIVKHIDAYMTAMWV